MAPLHIVRLLVVIASVAAIAPTGTTTAPTAGEPVEVAVHSFPAADRARAWLEPGGVPLGFATVSASSSMTVFLPVWTPPGTDEVVFVDRWGRREVVRIYTGSRVLPWPVTMRVQGLR